MQTNYYFLRQLSKHLAKLLVGKVLAECFSQEKDELLLGFCHDGKQWRAKRDFYLKAVLHPDFACLNFPDDFRRAGRNSVDLFKELTDLKVVSVRQFLNERAFGIYFENDFVLLFKMYGNRSNVILLHENKVIDLLHNKLVVDNNIDLDTLDREIDQSENAFLEKGWKALFPTFGKEISSHLQSLSAITWQEITSVLNQIEKPNFYLKMLDYQPFALVKTVFLLDTI